MMFRTRGVDDLRCIMNLVKFHYGNENGQFLKLFDSCKAVLQIARRSIDAMFQSRNTVPGRTIHARKPCDVGF